MGGLLLGAVAAGCATSVATYEEGETVTKAWTAAEPPPTTVPPPPTPSAPWQGRQDW